MFILSRVIAGLSKGIVGISTALVTDATTVKDRSKAMVSFSEEPDNGMILLV